MAHIRKEKHLPESSRRDFFHIYISMTETYIERLHF